MGEFVSGQGGEWKKPVASQANPKSQKLKSEERQRLNAAVNTLKTEQRLRKQLKSVKIEAAQAMSAAKWAAREASFNPDQRGALEAAREIVRQSNVNRTRAGERIVQRASRLQTALKSKAGAVRQYESDNQVFESSHAILDQRTSQALNANPGWW